MKDSKRILEITLGIIAVTLIFMAGLMVKTTLATPAEAAPSKAVMTIDEVANYLDLTSGAVMDIVLTEEAMLKETHVHDGLLFPYYKMNQDYYFVKSSVDAWLEDISKNRKHYDLVKKTVF